MRIILLSLCFLMGCYAPLTDLEPYMKKKYHAPEHATVAAVMSHYFTKKANVIVKDIPCVLGNTYKGSHAAGVNFWSSAAAFLMGNGIGRKCLMAEKTLREWGPESIIHEYIHHLDDIGRDGGPVSINLDEFKKAYVRMFKDHKWRGYVLYAERKSNSWLTNTFGIGPMSEQIAYVGARIAAYQLAPDYVWHVYRKVLINHHGKKVGGKSN